ncbi:hypothetical protein [Nocardia concava]|uniref:hypothetical protein n=1 Tax=Nocardia concava TaxID=257281 RepID=UPI0012F72997|nr:hypothetical protein [Nocardia concava]
MSADRRPWFEAYEAARERHSQMLIIPARRPQPIPPTRGVLLPIEPPVAPTPRGVFGSALAMLRTILKGDE